MGVQGAALVDILRSRHKNLVQFIEGYEEREKHGHLKQGIREIENYVDYLLAEKKNIIFIVPKNLFTFFKNRGRRQVLATIREFEYLVNNFPDNPDLIHFVFELMPS